MSEANNDINPIESVQKIPKKRGRKPKGGKIVQSSLSSDNNNSTPNVILQLKCGADDLKNLGNFSSKEFNYAPQQIDEKINPYQFNEENNCFGIVNQPEIKKETVIVDENILEDNESDKESIYQKLKMLAHDLRTPIAGIKLTASLLTNSTDANVRVYQNHIIDMCNNTMLMMDDLLSHIKISSNGFRINLTRLKIEDELREVCKSLEVQFLSKNITVILPQSETYLELDSVKFTQIVSNLVTNAIKFSYPDGTISIYVNNREEYVDLVIKDNGIGISEEDLPLVFNRFYRVDKARSRQEGGTGLGLSICKFIVGAHKGSIKIKSKLGKGTKFKITLPKSAISNQQKAG